MRNLIKKKAPVSLLLLVLLLALEIIPAGGLTGSGQGRVSAATSNKEYRAFWFSFYDYEDYRSKNTIRNATTFQNYFTKVVKNGKSLGMNTIIVQVRPFGDALYQSSYFPWSEVISGKQGVNPGFDPLAIMVSVAHSNGLRIEAWINPYRVTSSSTNYNKLSPKNQARKWHNKKSTKRNVLSYNGKLYYNPSKAAVRKLIVNGVKEIVTNYNVDGIHMDDYFYPSFSKANVKKAFDAKEYKASSLKKQGKSITYYRRTQVNLLVKQIHDAVKAIKPSATFGISPAGVPSELLSSYAHYVDYRTWMRSTAYIDYICPQVYWGFYHVYSKYDVITDKWVAAAAGSPVKLYIGVAVYKVGYNVGTTSSEKKEWKKDSTILKRQVLYGRSKGVDGFAFFDYSDLVRKNARSAVQNLKTVLTQ